MKINVKAWIEAMRLRTLPVSIAGVVVGIGCACFYDTFRILPALICLLFAITAQIVSNFANEYYDFKAGFDKKGRDGFRRGVTEGDITPSAMKKATFGLLAFDCLLGCTLLFYGSWWLIPVGVAIALGALAYSTGPYPLSHHGLGDIAVLLFYGVVPVVFTCYVITGEWNWHSIAIPMSVAVGLMADNVLIVNNYRDVDDDRAVGKHTLVVILGRKVMSYVYLLFGYGAVAIAVETLWSAVSGWWLIAAGIIIAVHTLLWHKLRTSTGSALNPLLGKTAILLLASSLLLLLLMV